MSDCAAQTMRFETESALALEAAFDGGRLTSDGGLLWLSEVDSEMGLCEAISEGVPEWRTRKARHSLASLVRQRVFQIACGYEDQNDSDTLREDPLLKLSGLDPGRRTNHSFGYECRRRESTRCRERHQATRQNSNEKLSALSAPHRTGASPRSPGSLASRTTLCVAGLSRQRSIRESGKDCPPRSEKSSVGFAARIGFSSRRKRSSEKPRPFSPGRTGSGEIVQVHRCGEGLLSDLAAVPDTEGLKERLLRLEGSLDLQKRP